MAGDVLYMFYAGKLLWRPYWPFLLHESFFWFVIITSFLNIVTAKILGNVDLRRIKFHHYFYGFLISVTSFIFLALSEPAYLSILLMPILIPQIYGSTVMPISTIFLLVYGGMTLMIDDVQDVSLKLRGFFTDLKSKLKGIGRMIETLHLSCSLASIYVTLSVIFWIFSDDLHFGGSVFHDLSAWIFTLNLFITSIWGLGMVKKRVWLKNFYFNLQPKSRSSSTGRH